MQLVNDIDCAYLLHRVYRNVENIEFVEIYRKGTKFIIVRLLVGKKCNDITSLF